MIAYAVLDERVAIWAYDDRGVFARWAAAPPNDIRKLTAKLQRLCAEPTSDLSELRATARSLYDLLVQPIEGHLDARRSLIFEPDDFLASLPWDTLLDANHRYLGERFATAVVPGLYCLINLHHSMAISAGTPALIVSVPVVPGLVQLRDAENEARGVAAMLPNAKLLEGKEASLSAIEAEMPGKFIFHFAGHAIASAPRNGLALWETEPGTDRFRLIDGRAFTTADTQKIQLAVLSACNSDDWNDGDMDDRGTEGLATALLRAGVAHVVASRWRVDSSETASFMKLFYVSLLNGNSPAGALQTARTSLASEPASAHPYYWSAFLWKGNEPKENKMKCLDAILCRDFI